MKDDPLAAAVLNYEWRSFNARAAQIPPDGDWLTWLILAGRGFGKTRTGAEWVREKALAYPNCRIALVGATAADVRDTMVLGESGILAISPPWFKPKYEPSKRRLVWPNGSIATLYSAEEPERLRGPQQHFAWCDELCAWFYLQETWDQMMFGLRLPLPDGRPPQVVVTTTPKPQKLLKEIYKSEDTITTKGATYENRENLAPQFYKQVVKRYEGTRLGRQEINAEILDDNPGALWQYKDIADYRLPPKNARELLERCDRVVIGCDPPAGNGSNASAGSDSEGAAEAGLIVAGRCGDEGYIFADGSLMGSPAVWADRTVGLYDIWDADAVIAEVNNGGDMVTHTIQTARKNINVLPVRASRGKITRAEPIAALYEKGRIHHVGIFPQLEEQMCGYDPTISVVSPDRMDALVWALSHLFNEVSAEPRVRSL